VSLALTISNALVVTQLDTRQVLVYRLVHLHYLTYQVLAPKVRRPCLYDILIALIIQAFLLKSLESVFEFIFIADVHVLFIGEVQLLEGVVTRVRHYGPLLRLEALH